VFAFHAAGLGSEWVQFLASRLPGPPTAPQVRRAKDNRAFQAARFGSLIDGSNH
jgi:hypothetical protein